MQEKRVKVEERRTAVAGGLVVVGGSARQDLRHLLPLASSLR